MAANEPMPTDPEPRDERVVPLHQHAELPPAVAVDDLSVRFSTTKETKRSTFMRRLRHPRKSRRSKQVIEALSSVSFEVPTGTVYGVIGPNGAGKSTLCRTIAGILPPSDGKVLLRGRVTPLLSLGLGFNRELTGRENIRLGGLANGLDLDTITECTDDIVEFADLGDAIDYPMYTYSSGMFARVGFAVAAHLKPEILIIDEALSAGDASFKNKCTARIRELCESEVTVLIVSHGLDIVKLLAERCLWLDDGVVKGEGATEEIVGGYLESQGLGEEPTAMEDM